MLLLILRLVAGLRLNRYRFVMSCPLSEFDRGFLFCVVSIYGNRKGEIKCRMQEKLIRTLHMKQLIL